MAQRFDELFTRKRKRGSSKSATLLLFLDTLAAIILLHPVKVVPKVWYSVGIDLSTQRCGVKLYRPQMSCIL